MRKILKIKEWLENRKLVGILSSNAKKYPLLDNLVDIRPFEGMPIGKIFYLERKHDTITGELPFED